MSKVITTAGRKPSAPTLPSVDPRKAALAHVRSVIRDPRASDADVDDALEALIELSRS